VEDQIFDANAKPWIESSHGRTKVLLGDRYSKTSRFRLFNLKAGEVFTTHEHDFTQCMYFTSGIGEVSVDDTKTKIYPGLTVIVLPQQCHSIVNLGDEEMNVVVFESQEVNLQDTPFVDF
jgi:quercetin dioxygenase-like cupin family protein